MKRITKDPKVEEAFDRFSSEIRNKTFAEAYLAVADCINQKEYCKRIGVSESRFSRVLNKLERDKMSPGMAVA